MAFLAGPREPGQSGVFKFVKGELTEIMGDKLGFGPGPSISHGHVAYIGGGIFFDDERVVDPTTIAPDGGTFVAIGPGPDISGNAIAFLSTTSNGGGGVFVVTRAGHVTWVVDGSTGAHGGRAAGTAGGAHRHARARRRLRQGIEGQGHAGCLRKRFSDF